MKREFTGKHMATVMVTGFGIVIAVNLLMATLATSGFGGVVVENSYVASQKYNGWLESAREQEALGWKAAATRREDGRIVMRTTGLPEGARVSAELRRPLGQPETRRLAFSPQGENEHVSRETVAGGRWIARISIAQGANRWVRDMPLE